MASARPPDTLGDAAMRLSPNERWYIKHEILTTLYNRKLRTNRQQLVTVTSIGCEPIAVHRPQREQKQTDGMIIQTIF